MLPCIIFAIYLPQTLWRLMEFKLELLIQIAPIFFIGLYLNRPNAIPFIAGLVFGSLTVTLMNITGIKLGPIHTGIIGLSVNLFTLLLVNIFLKQTQKKIMHNKLEEI